MSRLVLVRHGQSVWNAEGRWQGWADPPLTALGEAQAATAGRRMAGLGMGKELSGPAVSSDLRRAAQTAEILADQLGMTGPILHDPELREIDVGEWSGLRREDIGQRWPEWLARWDAGQESSAPGGEPRQAFDARVLRACARWLGEEQDDQILVVAHGGVIRSLSRSLGHPRRVVSNLGGVLVTAGPTGLTVQPLPEWAMDAEVPGQALPCQQ